MEIIKTKNTVIKRSFMWNMLVIKATLFVILRWNYASTVFWEVKKIFIYNLF